MLNILLVLFELITLFMCYLLGTFLYVLHWFLIVSENETLCIGSRVDNLFVVVIENI